MRDFAITVTQRPGEIARAADALARKDVNIKALAGLAIGNEGMIRVIAEDVEAARAALKEGNIRFEESELVTVLLENRAGELSDLATKLANANVNIQAMYVIGLDGNLVELAIA